MSRYRLAVMEGDGIGPEIVPEAVRVLDAAACRRRRPAHQGTGRGRGEFVVE